MITIFYCGFEAKMSAILSFNSHHTMSYLLSFSVYNVAVEFWEAILYSSRKYVLFCYNVQGAKTLSGSVRKIKKKVFVGD